MKLKPIKDRVLVRIQKPEEVTKSGIIIPETSQQKTDRGEIIEVGETIDFDSLKVGDVIVYEKYKGTTLTMEGVDYIILHEEDVIAKEV